MARLVSIDDAYELGMLRGSATGRNEPNDADLDWFAAETDRRERDEHALIAFAQGMFASRS